MKSAKARETASIVSATAAACAAIAVAAPVQAADDKKDEIIVTATKRAQSIYDVPISVSAIDLETIERKGVRDLEELSRSVPSLVVSFGDESGPKSFTIRGIGADGASAETAAVYVDDTPLTVGEASVDLKLFDIDRVEVLRGPQGTLFGSSAMGGAIRYVMAQPGYDEFSGRVRAEAGTIKDGNATYEGQMAFGGPLISDRLAFRASGFYRRDGGYVDLVDEFSGALIDRDVNTIESGGGRFALGARLSDDFEAVASILYQNQHYADFPTYYTAAGVGLPPPVGLPVLPLGDLQKVERAPVNDRTDEVFLPNLTLNWDLGGVRMTSSTSYMNYKLDEQNDFSYFLQPLVIAIFGADEASTNGLVAINTQDHVFDAFIQEIRFASTGEGPFEWLIGGYYRDAKKTDVQFNFETSGILGFPDNLLYTRDATDTIRELAAFGELSYSIFDDLKLTAGLRYTDLRLTVVQSEAGPFASAAPVDEESSENALTPRFSASWNVTDEMMFYATAAKGFREGGPNQPAPLGACDADLAALGLTAIPTSYSSDSLWSYEVGVKAQSGIVSFQGAAYHIDWTDIQQSLGLSCGAGYIDNLGKAEVNGVELETILSLTDNFSIEANGTYTDATLSADLVTGFDPMGVPVVLAPEGARLPNVPSTTANIAALYEFALDANWGGYIRAELQHIGQTKRNFGEGNPATVDRDSFRVLSARMAITTGPYEFSIFADNITNERPLISKGGAGGDPALLPGGTAPGAGFALSTIRPRLIGISAAMSF